METDEPSAATSSLEDARAAELRQTLSSNFEQLEQNKIDGMTAATAISELLTSVDNISLLFPLSESTPPALSAFGIDLALVRNFFVRVNKNADVRRAVNGSFLDLMKNLEIKIGSTRQFAALRFVLEDSALIEYEPELLYALCRRISHITGEENTERFVAVLAKGEDEWFRSVVDAIQQAMTLEILNHEGEQGYVAIRESCIKHMTLALLFFYNANVLAERENENGQPKIPFEVFANDGVNQHAFDVRNDVRTWKTMPDHFCFSKYSFVLTLVHKETILNIDCGIQRFQNSRSMLGFLPPDNLVLNINRHSVIRDAITLLGSVSQDDPERLRKQLKIKFIGEEGIDEGGVQKEFFQLAIRDLFDPKYGMFTYNEDTRLHWFNPASLETPSEFTLLGVLLALAIYNSVILDLHFPMLVYKKLLGEPTRLQDLAELDPSLAHSLRSIAAADKDTLEAMELTFTVPYEYFGEAREHELIPDGAKTAVTIDNKDQYVERYVDYVLNSSVKTQFDAFKKGFMNVMRETTMKYLRPYELATLICGTKEYDFTALEESTRYDGGFSADHQVIKWFWKAANSLTAEEKKKLLFFSTGTDRVPVGGLGKLQFIIAKQGADSERLPTAHTCFNVLLLPEYSSEEKLNTLLRKALSHAEGFGMY
eukprot:m.152094 g.152094  ORF g.152094 m.152094 type:complete len:653 (+) comp16912_c0_seq1:114-2072(+)